VARVPFMTMIMPILGLYQQKKLKNTAPFNHLLLWVYREKHEGTEKYLTGALWAIRCVIRKESRGCCTKCGVL